MSTKNNVSFELTEAELQSVREAIATLKAILNPHLIALSPQDRQRILKMSDGTLPFLEKVMDYAKDDEQFLPPFVDFEELGKDWTVVKSLMPAYRDLKQLESNLNDTLMMAGSEAYMGALGYYNSVKFGARMNVSDAKVIYDDLRKRFNRPGSTVPTNGTDA